MALINVIGLGYIGLPVTLSLAAAGAEVVGTDISRNVIDSLNKGQITFQEQGLTELFHKAQEKGCTFSLTPVPADVYIIAVPTPYDLIKKTIDTRYLQTAIRQVLPVLRADAVIAVESTISPGTMNKVVRPLVSEYDLICGKDVHIAHVPERIIPGNMLYELRSNSRTIGVESDEAGRRLAEVYKLFCSGEIVVTSIKVAEMTKVIENAFRDVNIAFANELSQICHKENISVYEVIRIANMHPRVNILNPGPGVGGHCISVDPWFLVGDYPDIVDVILSARHVNDSQPSYVLRRVRKIMREHNIKDLSEVGFYGLTYKEDVDDTRESPTLQLLEKMQDNLAFRARVYDPLVKLKIAENQFDDFESFLCGVELVVVMVGHKHLLENLDKLDGKLIYDTRNCIEGAIPL